MLQLPQVDSIQSPQGGLFFPLQLSLANMENGEGFFQQSSTTGFGLESVLRQNIVNSEYYRSSCMTLKTVSEVVDEIYNSVQHLEPWMSGNARGPSSAFCLMHRLFTMRVTEDELQAMIDHEDSPYIRAVSGSSAVMMQCTACKGGGQQYENEQ